MTAITQYDELLTTDTWAALTAKQLLEPVEGTGAVIFPPTFASPTKGEKGDYNIDPISETAGGGNVCIIDPSGLRRTASSRCSSRTSVADGTPRWFRKSSSR